MTAAGRSRRFGRPRLPDATERVWLVCDAVPAAATVLVNGAPVGNAAAGGPSFAADVTSLLNPRNEVLIVTPSADPFGEVALEIRPAGIAPA